MIFTIYIYSLMKCLFKYFVHLLIESICLSLSFKSSLHILETCPLSDVDVFCKYFLPNCLFILSTVSCIEQKFSILTKPNFTHFFVVAWITLLMYFKTHCQTQESYQFSPICSSISIIVLYLKHRSMIYLALIVV